MIFKETRLPGAYIIEPEKIADERGYFTRIWCKTEFQRHGLKGDLAQSNAGFSHRRGTLRGLHFQTAPHAEVKIVRCTRGSIFDVIVDLRPESPAYKRWFGIELNDENSRMLYVPEGFAQGYITLTDNTEMNYHTSKLYTAEAASGVRYDDAALGIHWPLTATTISEQDRNWPLIEQR